MPDPVSQLLTVRLIQVRADQERKLIPADAEGMVLAPDAPLQAGSHLFQQLVPHVMAVGVVDGLEVIQIQVEEHEGKLFLLLLLQNGAKMPPVEQARQTVCVGHGLQRHPFSNVLRDHHDLRQRTLCVPFHGDHMHDLINILVLVAVLKLHAVLLCL